MRIVATITAELRETRSLCETPLVLSGGSRGQSAANASPEFLAVEEVLLALEDGRRNDANASQNCESLVADHTS